MASGELHGSWNACVMLLLLLSRDNSGENEVSTPFRRMCSGPNVCSNSAPAAVIWDLDVADHKIGMRLLLMYIVQSRFPQAVTVATDGAGVCIRSLQYGEMIMSENCVFSRFLRDQDSIEREQVKFESFCWYLFE